MAIHDAIQAAASDWDAVEPYLAPAHLAAIAKTGVEDEDLEALEERLLDILSPVVPTQHRMWTALLLDNSRRSYQSRADDVSWDTDWQAPARLIQSRAYEALTSPDVANDAVADSIVEATKRRILGFGYRLVPKEPDLESDHPTGAVGIPLDNANALPAFQFADQSLTEVHHSFMLGMEFLGADEDPLGALAWWVTPNAWLASIPATLLGTSREPEIIYAAEQILNDSW